MLLGGNHLAGVPGDTASLIFVGGVLLSAFAGVAIFYLLIKCSWSTWWASLGSSVVQVWMTVITAILTIRLPLWQTVVGLTVVPFLFALWSYGMHKFRDYVTSGRPKT